MSGADYQETQIYPSFCEYKSAIWGCCGYKLLVGARIAIRVYNKSSLEIQIACDVLRSTNIPAYDSRG